MKLCTLYIFGLCVGVAMPSLAQTPTPARKSGLWEETQTSNLNAKPWKNWHCVGAGPEHALEMEMGDAHDDGTCTRVTVTRKQELFTLEKRCKLGKSSTYATASYKGNFDSSYEMTYSTSITPAYDGQTELSGTVRARWVGPCQSGQRPGDVWADGGVKTNLLDLRKTPVPTCEPPPQSRGAGPRPVPAPC